MNMDELPASCLPDTLLRLGAGLCRQARTLLTTILNRRFRALFGVTPVACNTLWHHIPPTDIANLQPVHLLTGLLFLKVYSTECVHATLIGLDEKPVRNWQWRAVCVLGNLRLVCSH